MSTIPFTSASGKTSKPGELSDRAAGCIGSAVFVVLATLLYFFALTITRDDLSVVASERAASFCTSGEARMWKVKGHVRNSDMTPAANALVYLCTSTARGEVRVYEPTTTDDKGGFAFDDVCAELSNPATGPVSEIRVTAFVKKPTMLRDHTGTYVWTVRTTNSGTLHGREIAFSLWFIAPLGCFLVSLILVGWVNYPKPQPWLNRSLRAISLVLTALMTGIVGYSIMWVSDHIPAERPGSLGFLHFYRGTYVKDGNVDWLVSLTSPTLAQIPRINETGTTREVVRSVEEGSPADRALASVVGGWPLALAAPPPAPPPAPSVAPPPTASQAAPPAPPIAAGLGAPLWVVFVAVLGSGLMMVVLVIGESLESFNGGETPAEQEKRRKRFVSLLEHQFFALFSPLGAVFVYQLMLAGGAAGSPVIVAITTLGAGATLNGLLVRAVKYAAKWVEKENETKPATPPAE